jgi:sugar lactone lactonase YvrE
MVIDLQTDVLLTGLTFGEGPRWHDGKLWFSDIWGHKVMTVDLDGNSEVLAELEEPSGLGFLEDGRLLISTFDAHIKSWTREDGLQDYADLTGLASRANDMVVDGAGNAYVDLYPERDEDAPIGETRGSIGLVPPDGQPRIVAEGLRAPNGLVVTPDGQRLIVNEVLGSAIQSFAINADGSLGDQQLFAALDDESPDGLCLDAEGAVWIGSYNKSRCLRVREGGEITHRIETPGRWAVAPMLGGPDRKTLFLMTAVVESLDRLIETGEAKGSIETVRVDVPGAGWP